MSLIRRRKSPLIEATVNRALRERFNRRLRLTPVVNTTSASVRCSAFRRLTSVAKPCNFALPDSRDDLFDALLQGLREWFVLVIVFSCASTHAAAHERCRMEIWDSD